MREQLNYLLSRKPRIYEGILRLKGSINFEKTLFLNLIKDGDVVFDIGANRGYYTLLFSHLVGKAGQVHAFEPVPPTFKQLARSITVGKRFENVFLNEVALSDSSGPVKLYMPNDDDGQASLRTHSRGSWEGAETITAFDCQAIKLDEYISSNPQKRLDFIKCDIEGAELPALKGAFETLTRFTPIVHLEVCSDWTKNFYYHPVEIIKYLSSLGYSEFHLATNGPTFFYDSVDELSIEEIVGSHNLLCSIPKLHSHKVSALFDRFAVR